MSDEQEIERDELECGALFVGAGPASLAGAIRLMQLINAHNEAIEAGELEADPIDVDEAPVMIIEKASAVGDHSLSGAILDPRALNELFPGWYALDDPPPLEGAALDDSLYLMLGKAAIKAPIMPPTFHNDGCFITSLNKLVKWLAEQAEELGVQILPDFPGAEVLFDHRGQVRGVRTADKGIDKNGQPKGSFEPGTDLLAPITIFGEGSRGSLTRELVRCFGLDQGRNPQIYSTGVKELWKVPAGRMTPGEVIHTAGFPLKLTGDEFGGGFIYSCQDDHVSIGLVVSLDSPDPAFDPHRLFSEWKNHPLVKGIIEGGECVAYGAKTIPEGGWYSLPRPHMPGAMLVGDSAGYLNMTRLKGIHLAMKSGMLAAEATFEILRDKVNPSVYRTEAYWNKVEASWIKEEMYKVRNFRQAFQKKNFGFLRGALAAGLHIQSGGLWPPWKVPLLSDHDRMRKLVDGPSNGTPWKKPPAPLPPSTRTAADVCAARADGVASSAPLAPALDLSPSIKTDADGVIYDKATDVYYSGATHEEDQPAHLVVADLDICHTRCAEEYGNPCQYFCPAGVYEMTPTDDGKGRKLHLNFSNCVHCKTCDIRDPYQIITWVPPEGGGPTYAGL